jgi:hypothetical protein
VTWEIVNFVVTVREPEHFHNERQVWKMKGLRKGREMVPGVPGNRLVVVGQSLKIAVVDIERFVSEEEETRCIMMRTRLYSSRGKGT